MQNNLEVHGGRNRSPLYLALIVLLFGSGVAAADGTAPAAANAIGVMSFPNVRVVNTPELASSSAPAAKQTGLRAYVDPVTGALRQPTEEELIAESLAAQQAAALAPQATQSVRLYDPLSGAVGVRLGDSQMPFSVVQKTETGELAEFCVVGPEQAARILNLKAPSLSALPRKGERYDR